MGKEIKTRHIHKDIKALDKTVTGVERVKRAYVRTKDSAEQTQAQNHDTPVEYAEDNVMYGADTAVHEAAHQVRKQGGKAVDYVKDSRGNSKSGKYGKEGHQATDVERPSFSPPCEEKVYQPKEQLSQTIQREAGRKKAQKKAGQKAVQQQLMQRKTSEKTAAQMGEFSRQTIKTIDRGDKTIKTTYQTGRTIKASGKGTVKTSGRMIKTVGQGTKATVKTVEQTAKAAQRAAKASAKASEKAARATRQAARAAQRATKTAIRATAAAVRAIIAATKTLIATIGAGSFIALLLLIIVILFGGILCMMGGDNSSTVSPVSAEVEAYEPLIRQYANQYGIGEYVELIKAAMMQESGGRGLDPMQSSEGGFNTRYPREPNGIADPEYSIQCGVQELKSCLVSAEVENPLDMQNIKLALQGYNFGSGYISWARSNYGGYTAANAAEFSDMMAQRMGWSGYGDKQYVPHVLRYYAFGRILMGTGSQAIVAVALTQEGNGGDTYWGWYGFSSREEWCACFVSWCAEQCGYIESGVIPKFSLCSDGAAWFDARGQLQDGSYVPAPGDIIFFDWGTNGSIDHVGIVESVSGGVVNTVEGNSGDIVARRSYSIGDGRIYGYGVAAY